ncbi:bcl-2-like protein 2 isoform X1 [Marmota marmota marmota]|uniref:Bcl-2-like protein 2 n=30 Tax=Boreoeutheria TaxID=1437010 RepID=A0A8C0Q5E6_CANLF|nr:polyadenylate-binding protein 2 isoform X2 [Physeter catodon]XP_025863321.1 polyadenylate-binding protein 2 isoform X1 [Vulpes vulpes]XP_029806374.1 polyadenylate-binding protein 2 isoform X3 [Suricata suricatta]XP_030876876.1 polyadenylate-binding protein 2 isoform X1 [Leptonychotes weddellii]XP_030876877.1 polyadenylate-binding protein 2 isoform X1 [Leptonychotes weddellii]XP_034504524.1 polyadenylate-binding protein 2 isoform X1 [Ailuropoda melanoleuca]XP_036893317.1 polyadenylate-bindi|eukprot:NP_001186793.1 BCL2L2-PABPN1 protein [Homo sapiens]
MATPASAPDTRALVADFVGYKLRQKGYVCGAGPGEGPAADPLHQAMRAAGDEFETRFRRTFSDLAAQLHVTPGSAQQRFTQVSDELFQGGPNWGRLVAFFVFGAALCAESVNKEMEPLVGQVQEWMVAYLETRLADWIHSSGGWELEAIKARVREMEEEAEKLKELQNEVEKQMNMSPPPGNAGPVIMSIEEKMEADARSIYVGNVDYGATAEELEAHFHGCGSVNRVTILCDKFSGHPKGFAYIEFSDKESVRTSLALDESLFRGRQIKVIPKRTNRPGISTTDRGFPRARYRARTTNYNSSRSRFYSGFNSRPRGRVYRGRARATSWYSPY